jgi:hypothetical protein
MNNRRAVHKMTPNSTRDVRKVEYDLMAQNARWGVQLPFNPL